MPVRLFHLLSQLTIFMLLAFSLIGCEPGGGAQQKVDAARARNDGPPIWVAVDHDSTLYLYGTVHLLPDNLDWQKDDMRGAFDEAGTIFFELDNSPAATLELTTLVQKLGYLPAGQTLTARLDDYETKLLTAAALNSDIPLAVLDSMQPWLASEFLTVGAAAKVGLTPDLSADNALKSRAARQQKNTVYLDTPEAQIRASADQPDDVQMALLLQTLERFNGLGADLQAIAQAWAIGDVAELTRLTDSGMKTRLPQLYDALYATRNRDWSLAFTKFLEGSGTGFAAIGVSHLLGPDSVQNLLRDQGYEVTRYYAFQGERVIRPVDIGTSQ